MIVATVELRRASAIVPCRATTMNFDEVARRTELAFGDLTRTTDQLKR